MMRVLYVQYTNPGAYPPLVRGAQLLARSGAQVMMLGTRVRGIDNLDAPVTPGVEVQLMPAPADGWRLKAHYARYAAWVAREARRWKPDWVYVSDALAAPIGVALGSVVNARTVYHEHDAPSRDHATWMAKRCLEARARLLRTADVVVAPNAERAERLAALAGGRDVITAWNCPRRPRERPEMSRTGDWLRVLFRGSINPDRLPLTVIDAVARVKAPIALDVAGYETVGSIGYVDAFASRARDLGVSEHVRMLGTVPDSRLQAIGEYCDIGLALMPAESADENMRHMTGASNKVFEYLGLGVAPLVSDLPDWRHTFVDPGYALACDPSNVDSIAAAFGWAAAHTAAVRSIAARGWQRLLTDWNYETQFAPVLGTILGDRAQVGVGRSRDNGEGVECAS